ncbi:vWA domain-containing protein [Lysinibacillus fusiformis]|uniref:vWA domain-containing protein n=1 Tax=Lysinibacillus fusiformis TaxID=28031 RepID=UPI0023A9C19C|nr:vWA domain-containing protein [Lysinibacillus fusiformis]WEA41648.1 VWA domain-containing protein [Lysinibacillus fusiformis]
MVNLQAIDLWQRLNHRFGLHLRKDGGRDNQLYNKLKENLGCPKEIGIDRFLKTTPNITALRFIQAFLSVTEPFSNMYKDIFAVMKEFSMKEAHETVKISCELDNENLDFNLEHFKELIRVESLVRQTIDQRDWEPAFMNEIPHFFKLLTNNSMIVNDNQKLAEVLEPPKTHSHPKLDEYLYEIYNLLLNIKNQKLGDSDWYGSYGFAKPYYDEFISNGLAIDIEKAIAYYERVFSMLKSKPIEIEVIVENLEEYLNLPFWKNRWYVYEVWITLRTVKALKNYKIQLNVGSEGVLPLKSGRYSKVGSFIDEKNQEYTLHAQLQTAVDGFENRKGMEPDLRITKGNKLESNFTKIIIECKQRIHMNKEQLEKNIKLYEYGARNSNNIFVNYDVFPDIEWSKFQRTQLLSDVRPNNTKEFYKVVNHLLLTSNIIPPKNKKNYCALLIDSSGSMDIHLTSEIKDELLTILETIEVDKYFYFNSDLIEPIYDTPKTVLENLVPNGGTNLDCALKTLVKKHSDIKSLLIIADHNPIPNSSEKKKYFDKIQVLNITEKRWEI